MEERLTEKDSVNAYWNKDKTVNGAWKVSQKLGQHEDIEEELGIDLITFFKYLGAKEVFYKEYLRGISRVIVRSIDKKGLIVFQAGFGWGECDFTLDFKDYGKTWALTKEELE